MTEDEELRELTQPWPDVARVAEAAAAAAHAAFEEEWWREPEERQSTCVAKAENAALSPPLGRAGKEVP